MDERARAAAEKLAEVVAGQILNELDPDGLNWRQAVERGAVRILDFCRDAVAQAGQAAEDRQTSYFISVNQSLDICVQERDAALKRTEQQAEELARLRNLLVESGRFLLQAAEPNEIRSVRALATPPAPTEPKEATHE